MVRLGGMLILCRSFPSFAGEGVSRVGAGDLVAISGDGERDLSLGLRCGLSGNISYPLLCDVKVAGLSPKELEVRLVEKLKCLYLIDPSVNVNIMEYRPFYVTGEVEKPGSYAFHPGLNVARAISISGGFTERASKSKIYVVHDSSFQSESGASIEKRRISIEDVVRPGDVITVEQSFF